MLPRCFHAGKSSPSSCVPVELKPVQLVCAGKCKSRADKGISSCHGLRLARSTAAACLLPPPMRGGGKENPNMETNIHHSLEQKQTSHFRNTHSPGRLSLDKTRAPRGAWSKPPSRGLRHLFSLCTPLPPTPKPPQPKAGPSPCAQRGPGGPPLPRSPPAIERPAARQRRLRAGTVDMEKGKKKETNNNNKTFTLGPVPLITTAKPHQGFTLLEGEKATQRCPAPEVLEVGDPHTLSSMAYGLRPRRGAWFFCSVIKSGAWSFPSIPRIALN